jgi:assimilatory nitrate reductase electron transfer subunit
MSPGRSRVVVVGNGMSGLRFVQELLPRDPQRRLQVTVIGAERGGAYNRVLLSNVLAGRSSATDIELADEDWYRAGGVTLRGGRAAIELDRLSRKVILDDGSSVPYDVLVLATGSAAVVPPIRGLRADTGLIPGAVAFRTAQDCAEIARRARTARRAVVLGGGLLGVEAARGLACRGVAVAVLQRGPRLIATQLDPAASRVLTRTLHRLGIEIVTGAEVREVRGAAPDITVVTDDGGERTADLLVLCCGTRPQADLARAAGLAVGAGVLVDDQLRSVTDPRVFAIGECAEHRGRRYGLVAPCWEHARVAAAVVAGRPAGYAGSSIATRLKAEGVELAAMGESAGEDDDDIRFVDSGRGIYQKLVVRDGRLVGAILLGDTRSAGTVTQLFDRGAAVPVDRAALLLERLAASAEGSATPTALPGHATICLCNGVTKRAITDAWQHGARTVEQIARRTRATTGCGTCRGAVAGIAEWLTRAEPDVAVPAGERQWARGDTP